MKPLSSIDPEVQVLDKSLAFKMSLGAKELFHSNVMEWALYEFPNLCQQLFNIKAPITCSGVVDDDAMRVSRERQDVDLVVEIVTVVGPVYVLELIFVENKLKAIPDQEQLDKYKAKALAWTTKYYPKIPSNPPKKYGFEDDESKNSEYVILRPQPGNIKLFLMAPTCPIFFSPPDPKTQIRTYGVGQNPPGSPPGLLSAGRLTNLDAIRRAS